MSAGSFAFRWVVSIGAITAAGCHAPAPRTPAKAAASTAGLAPVELTPIELTPALVGVFTRVLWLPVLIDRAEYGPVNASYYDRPESTATDEQLADARARASDCATQISEWRRDIGTQPERAVEIAHALTEFLDRVAPHRGGGNSAPG